MGLGDPTEGQEDAPAPLRSHKTCEITHLPPQRLPEPLVPSPAWMLRPRISPRSPNLTPPWGAGLLQPRLRFEDKYLSSEPCASAISAAIPALPGSSFLNQSAFCMPSSSRSQVTIKAEDQYICTDYRYQIWSFSEQTVSVKLRLLW